MQEFEWFDDVLLKWEPNLQVDEPGPNEVVAFMERKVIFPHEGFKEHFKVGETWRCKVKRYATYGFAVPIEQLAAPRQLPAIEQLVDPKVKAYLEGLVESRLAEKAQQMEETRHSLERLRKSNPELFKGGHIHGVPVKPSSDDPTAPEYLRAKVLYQMVAGGYWNRRRIKERDLRRGLPSSVERHHILATMDGLNGFVTKAKVADGTGYSLDTSKRQEILAELEVSGHAVEDTDKPVSAILAKAEEQAEEREFVDRGEFAMEIERLKQALLTRSEPVVVYNNSSATDPEVSKKIGEVMAQVRGLQGEFNRLKGAMETAGNANAATRKVAEDAAKKVADLDKHMTEFTKAWATDQGRLGREIAVTVERIVREGQKQIEFAVFHRLKADMMVAMERGAAELMADVESGKVDLKKVLGGKADKSEE